jgi:hypothetical protein
MFLPFLLLIILLLLLVLLLLLLILLLLLLLLLLLPVPVAARSKPLAYGRSPAEFVGSNPTGVMDVCLLCFMLSGRGLCDALITRPEESYRLWCVAVRDLETSWMTRLWPLWVAAPQEKTITTTTTITNCILWFYSAGVFFSLVQKIDNKYT